MEIIDSKEELTKGEGKTLFINNFSHIKKVRNITKQFMSIYIYIYAEGLNLF